MNALKFIFLISVTVLSVNVASGQYIEALITEFKDGVLGPLGASCLGHDVLEVKKYEDFEDVFQKPFGANEYFITSSEGIYEYCMETVGTFLVSDYGYELYIPVYTINNGGEVRTFKWSAMDIKNSTEMTTVVDIDDSRTWTNSTILITNKSSYKIRLEYTSYGEKDVFFAIDKFVLKYPDDSWESTTVTDEPTTVTEETTTATEDTTVVTDVPTTVTEEATTPTEETTSVTNEPTVTPLPPPDSCSCECNCNYYCEAP